MIPGDDSSERLRQSVRQWFNGLLFCVLFLLLLALLLWSPS